MSSDITNNNPSNEAPVNTETTDTTDANNNASNEVPVNTETTKLKALTECSSIKTSDKFLSCISSIVTLYLGKENDVQIVDKFLESEKFKTMISNFAEDKEKKDITAATIIESINESYKAYITAANEPETPQKQEAEINIDNNINPHSNEL